MNSLLCFVQTESHRSREQSCSNREASTDSHRKQQIATQSKVIFSRSAFDCSIARKMDTNDAFTPSNQRASTRLLPPSVSSRSDASHQKSTAGCVGGDVTSRLSGAGIVSPAAAAGPTENNPTKLPANCSLPRRSDCIACPATICEFITVIQCFNATPNDAPGVAISPASDTRKPS